MTRLVFHPNYDLRFYGLERLHPFDSCKYGRAWNLLTESLGEPLRNATLKPAAPATVEQLRLVHSAEYLASLKSSAQVARITELAVLAAMPSALVDSHVLLPMRWATAGTILAAREALQTGFAANLSGGYHHAKPDSGEGFCAYSDIAISVAVMRQEGLLTQDDRVLYIDLDAHQGNGVCHAFFHDPRIQIFDVFNAEIYPFHDAMARSRIDEQVALSCGCDTADYLGCLRTRLPAFLNRSKEQAKARLAIYNAGTDILAGDPLGALSVSFDGILERDQIVLRELAAHRIPVVMLPSGGYTQESHRLIHQSLAHSIRELHPL